MIQIRVKCNHCGKITNPKIHVYERTIRIRCPECAAWWEIKEELTKLSEILNLFENFIYPGARKYPRE